MKTKYTLILCAILLVTATISGCTDADGPDTLFNEQTIQKLLDDDTPMNDAREMIEHLADSNDYDVNVVLSDNTGKPISIIVDDGENHLILTNTDAKPDVDEATLNGEEIYPTSAEAESPQTQLANEPSTDSDALYLKIFDRNYLENEVLGQPIENYRIPAELLGEPYHINDRGTKFWKNINGFEKYIESDYDGNTNMDGLKIKINDKNRLGLSDKNSDGNIDSIKGLINDEPIEITE